VRGAIKDQRNTTSQEEHYVSHVFVQHLAKTRTLLENLSRHLIINPHVFLDQQHRQLGDQHGGNVVGHPGGTQEPVLDCPLTKLGTELGYDVPYPRRKSASAMHESTRIFDGLKDREADLHDLLPARAIITSRCVFHTAILDTFLPRNGRL
jgi:hypothetical protein